jgi:putative transposase
MQVNWHVQRLGAFEDYSVLLIVEKLAANVTINRARCWRCLSVTGMVAYISELVSWLAGRLRSRAELELEVIALRHQLAVLRRQRPGRHRLSALDRLLWTWLYRVWPRCLNILVLVKPATVVQWHRQGFRLYWRWRSRSGRPLVDREVRDLIRQMNRANPLWGAPRIHGELLKLGIKVSQATVAKYIVQRVGTPSPTWRSFLRNEAIGIAAIDMFVAASASFRLLYVMVILALRSQKDCAVRCYAASYGSVAFAADN